MPTKKQLEEQIEEYKENDKMRIDEIDKAYDYSLLVQSDRDFWEQKSNNLKEENEKLKEELNLYKNKPQLGRSYSNCLRENKQLKEENEKLKNCSYEEYCNMVDENKLIKEFVDLKNELGEISDISDESKEDLEDYQLFCDAFDVPCAMEAIHNHWRYLPDESKKELIQKGLNPK